MGKIIKLFFGMLLSVVSLQAQNYCASDIVLVETLDGSCPTNYQPLEFKNYEISSEGDKWYDITLKNFCFGYKTQTTDCIDTKMFTPEVYEQMFEALTFKKPEFRTRDNCYELFQDFNATKSGFYTIRNGIELYCDMEYQGGGWIDVVKTLQRHPEYTTLFFELRQLDGLPIFMKNQIGIEGIYLKYKGSSRVPIVFHGSTRFKTKEAITNWVMQSGASVNNCTNSNYSPMRGPGFRDLSISNYMGKNAITGSEQLYLDTPIEGHYNGQINKNNILLWWGWYAGSTSTGCLRSYKIPTNRPALWFELLKIR